MLKSGLGSGLMWRFAGLYLCEGAPIGFLWWALPTILRERGVAVDRIGALVSWLVLPWALKFLWAPLLDMGNGRNLRLWIVCAQLVMAATLLPLALAGLERNFGWIACSLVVHALAAASQDAAIDALAIRSVAPGQQGRLNGWMQFGMLAGRSLFGGGALLARSWVGDRGVVLALSASLGIAALALALRTSWSPQARLDSTPQPVWRNLGIALRRRATWLGLLFAATAGAGFEALGAMAGPFLIDSGFDDRMVGRFFGLTAVVAMAAGGFLGGFASDRYGVRLSTAISGLGLGACLMVLAWLARQAPPPELLNASMTAIYFAIGAFTASSYSLFMALTDPALGATQFSAFMGATNLCESWSARVGGTLSAHHGYATAFAAPAVIGLLALPLLSLLRRRPEQAGRGPIV
ncbi:MAG: MFS transporter [Planctomycetes bacterium]|nr:MFS transporter [Planctomycetota bacterium]